MNDADLFDTLLAELQDPHPATRAAAVRAISGTADERAVLPLIWLLADESLWVRCSAAEALGELRSLEALPPLLQFLRLGVTRELTQMGMPSEVPIRFHSFSKTPDPAYNDWIAAQGITLGDLGFSIVVSARIALQNLGLGVTDALIPLLTDENPYMQYVAVQVLNSMSLRTKPLEALVAVLAHDMPLMRVNAARSLAKFGNLHATEPLIALLQDADPTVRRAAVEALATIRDKRAIAPLQAVQSDVEIAEAVYAALNLLEPPTL